MPIITAIAIYILVWWVTLFTVLPIGVRGQAEEDDITRGSEPGAPIKSNILRKFVITTILATLIWAIICGVIILDLIDLDNLPFMPDIPST